MRARWIVGHPARESFSPRRAKGRKPDAPRQAAVSGLAARIVGPPSTAFATPTAPPSFFASIRSALDHQLLNRIDTARSFDATLPRDSPGKSCTFTGVSSMIPKSMPANAGGYRFAEKACPRESRGGAATKGRAQ